MYLNNNNNDNNSNNNREISRPEIRDKENMKM